MLLSFLFTLFLAGIHLIGYKLKFLNKIPRSGWLSFGAGVSVSYVFIHLLPELAYGQGVVNESSLFLQDFLEHHLYLISLAGLVLFYSLERFVKRKEEKHKLVNQSEDTNVFWLHIASFSLYNLLIGYTMVHRDEEGATALFLFTVAMGFHFLINDFGLLQHHQKIYVQKGRWFLALAAIGGWGIGTFVSIAELYVMIIFAFLAGGIILNILKEELPDERQSRLEAFIAGAILYSIILIFAE